MEMVRAHTTPIWCMVANQKARCSRSLCSGDGAGSPGAAWGGGAGTDGGSFAGVAGAEGAKGRLGVDPERCRLAEALSRRGPPAPDQHRSGRGRSHQPDKRGAEDLRLRRRSASWPRGRPLLGRARRRPRRNRRPRLRLRRRACPRACVSAERHSGLGRSGGCNARSLTGRAACTPSWGCRNWRPSGEGENKRPANDPGCLSPVRVMQCIWMEC